MKFYIAEQMRVGFSNQRIECVDEDVNLMRWNTWRFWKCNKECYGSYNRLYAMRDQLLYAIYAGPALPLDQLGGRLKRSL